LSFCISVVGVAHPVGCQIYIPTTGMEVVVHTVSESFGNCITVVDRKTVVAGCADYKFFYKLKHFTGYSYVYIGSIGNGGVIHYVIIVRTVDCLHRVTAY